MTTNTDSEAAQSESGMGPEEEKLRQIYISLLSGKFYENYDRSRQLIGWLREIVDKPAAREP